MKRRHLNYIFFLAITLIFYSCGDKAPKGDIELNDGQKWKVNVEMMPPIAGSEKLVANFMIGDKKDYKSLASQLKDKNQQLISSCNMKGKSHDELHKWLHPYMAMVSNLEDAENQKAADQILGKMEKSFETFNQHFQ